LEIVIQQVYFGFLFKYTLVKRHVFIVLFTLVNTTKLKNIKIRKYIIIWDSVFLKGGVGRLIINYNFTWKGILETFLTLIFWLFWRQAYIWWRFKIQNYLFVNTTRLHTQAEKKLLCFKKSFLKRRKITFLALFCMATISSNWREEQIEEQKDLRF